MPSKKYTMETVTHKGKIAVEYKNGDKILARQATNRPLSYMSKMLAEFENQLHNVTHVKIIITTNGED